MQTQKRPNILIFMTDHQRWDMAPPYKRAHTPNLDRFYQESVAFTEAYCPSPHCCPARATFFTGLYPTEHGVWNNVDVDNTLSRGLYDGIRLWSDDFKDAGYSLYFTGKWHISAEETPADRGWKITYPDMKSRYTREQRGRMSASFIDWERYSKLDRTLYENVERKEGQVLRPGYPQYFQYGVNENPFRDGEVVGSAVEAILNREKTEKPWCHFVGTLGPHDPYYVPQKYLDMYDIDDIELPENFHDDMSDKPNLYRRTKGRYSQLSEREHRESIRHYLAFCSYEDALFGELLKAVEVKGELDNTLIVYCSDHGDYMGEHGLWAKGLPCFKSAYHIPVLIRWPGGIVNPGRNVEHFISLADFAPTFLEIAGIVPDRQFTGTSLVPFFKGEEPENWRDTVYTQSNGNELYGIQRSVMTREWKYVYNGFDFDELYNLKDDPNELHNLAGDPKYQAVVREMCKKMWKFAHDHKDTCVNPYIMVALAPYGPGIIFED